MAVVAEEFLGLYLKEIGVKTPVSSFFGAAATRTAIDSKQTPTVDEAIIAEPSVHYAPAEVVIPEAGFPSTEVAEPTPLISARTIETPDAVQPTPKVEVAVPDKTVKTIPITPVSDLKSLKLQTLACTACELSASRNEVVFGSGSGTSGIVFIGDSPSRAEDLAGEPMIGKKGELFVQMLTSVGFVREDVYVMHGVKCRPSHGRDPKPVEFAACEQWLVAQLDLLKPRMICLLGRIVGQSLLNADLSLAELREKQHSFRGIPVLVLDHPTFLLRVPRHKARAWEDLNRLKDFYESLPSDE